MSTSKRLGHVVSVAAATGLAFVLAMGCNQSHAAPEPGRDGAGSVTTGPKVETDNYVAEIHAIGPYKVGESKFEVHLRTKGDYHINKQYPYKWKVQDPAAEGVTYPKAVLTRDDGKFEEKTGMFVVPVAFTKDGRTHLEGTLSFSVCSDANCIMEKQTLSIDVIVAAK